MTAYQFGYLCGTILSPFILMVIIASIYYAIKKPNKPFREVMFSRWVVTASIILFLLSLSGRVNQHQQTEASHVYPSSEVQEFIAGCLNSAKEKLINSATAEKFCSCSITEIQKVYTYGEFKKVGQEIEKTKNIPSDYKRIITSCTQGSKS